MRVQDMTQEEFLELCKSRQEWGSKKYGDNDKFRDTSKDLLEEIADIVNIKNRRLMWLNKLDNFTDKGRTEILCKQIEILSNELFHLAKELDKVLPVQVEIFDRLGFDYLEYLREIEKANKAQNIEGV